MKEIFEYGLTKDVVFTYIRRTSYIFIICLKVKEKELKIKNWNVLLCKKIQWIF
jgi:hypothetical protein